jgi:rubrerythrin
MSADNWAKCPKCADALEKDRVKRIDDAAKQYGKIPQHEWEKLRDAAIKPEAEQEDTLREDYEIGVQSDGNFYVNYSGRCNECGFAFTYKDEKKVSLK